MVTLAQLHERLGQECALNAELAESIQSAITDLTEGAAKLTPGAAVTVQNLDLVTQILRSLARLHANLGARDLPLNITVEEIHFLVELDSLADRLTSPGSVGAILSKDGDVHLL